MAVSVDSNLAEPQHEAAFFYGLFLRGYPLEQLRQDIDVSPKVLERWKRESMKDPWYGTTIKRILTYRKNVLAIFDSLISREIERPNRLQ